MNCKLTGNPQLGGIKEHLFVCKIMLDDMENNQKYFIDECESCGKFVANTKNTARNPSVDFYPIVLTIVTEVVE